MIIVWRAARYTQPMWCARLIYKLIVRLPAAIPKVAACKGRTQKPVYSEEVMPGLIFLVIEFMSGILQAAGGGSHQGYIT